jgi:SAM-dependent methyltransferase
MSVDYTEVAKYYDYNPNTPDDIPFYIDILPSKHTTVLVLGCGTGRVTLPLAKYCKYIHGIDLSKSMISICKRKLAQTGIPPAKVTVEVGDITDFVLGQNFDLIIAPFRVLQNLETDNQVDALFGCIEEHLAPGGTSVLNVFKPYKDREGLLREWCTDVEQLYWEIPVEGGRVACYDRRPRMDKERLVLYPEHVYRHYEGDTLKEEVVHKLLMKCYYPVDFEELITAHGFSVVDRWGGYKGETFGEGPELVIQFTRSD